jgi:hypothetical protein
MPASIDTPLLSVYNISMTPPQKPKMGRPTIPNALQSVVQARVSAEEREQLVKMAAKRDVTLSSLVRELLLKGMG